MTRRPLRLIDGVLLGADTLCTLSMVVLQLHGQLEPEGASGLTEGSLSAAAVGTPTEHRG